MLAFDLHGVADGLANGTDPGNVSRHRGLMVAFEETLWFAQRPRKLAPIMEWTSALCLMTSDMVG
ncbi:MAG: hypothetical protein KatS3mg105_1228 [Gemmatales bacterium]|nr:MAG: hypothetical protein KatS3mg105_1228 [Gemmatales bacterium]